MTDQPFKFVFFGTDELSVGVASRLKLCGWQPALIITAPAKPKGRKLILTPSSLQRWAEEQNIPVEAPATLRPALADGSPNQIYKKLSAGFDFFLVVSYGKIIPQAILDLPKHGTLNVHPSLLPLYRGPTPMEAAILSGDEKTGVTVMVLDAEMDHGPILAQEEISLSAWAPYYEELRDKSAEIGARLLCEYLPDWLTGKIKPGAQEHSQATYTGKIAKEDGLIDFNDKPETNYRKVRAFTPWPGAYFFLKRGGKDFRVLIKKARLEDGELIIEKVVPEGKNEMDWESFKRGYLGN